MDFGLSEEQELLQDTVRSFVANAAPPPRVRALFDAGDTDDVQIWSGLAELGLLGLTVPEQYAGAGMELLDLALAAEALGEGAVPGPFFGHALACVAVTLGGSDAQRERWLGRLAAGEATGSVALAEPGSAWEPHAWETQLDGEKLRGRKVLVPHAADADVIIVGVAGGGLALVERAAPGLAVEAFDGVDRTRALASLALDGAPAEGLPDGAAAAQRLRDAGRVLLAADAFGASSALIEQTADYLGTREQFGMPLTQFQGIKHQLANLAADLEPARSLLWYAAHAFDHAPDEAERMAALAKAHITDRAMHTARECVELHGGIGFTWECDVHIRYRRVMLDRAFLGAPDALRERCADLAGW